MKLGFLVLNQSISSHNYNNQGAKFRASHDCNVIINEKKKKKKIHKFCLFCSTPKNSKDKLLLGMWDQHTKHTLIRHRENKINQYKPDTI